MNEKIREIASRVRELRELSDVGVEEMAAELNVPVETYREYESGSSDIPASVLYEIAHKLDVDMGLLLTGEETRMHIFTVTRKGEGVEVERRKDYRYENLAEKFIHKRAEPFIVSIEPKRGRGSFNSHPGQEFGYILEGTLKVYIHDNEIILVEGDCIYFDSSHRHAFEALDNRPVKMLSIVM